MKTSKPHTPKLLRTIRIPAGFREVIIENDLSKNDILVLLLILERTLDNVSPAKLETALSIRYIAELNHCVPKTAENSVKKLKTRKLIKQKVAPKSEKPSMMSLDYDRFPYAMSVSSAVSSAPGASPAPSVDDHSPDDEITAIREMLHRFINSSRKREAELPEPFLAASLLDHFGTSSAVEEWLTQLHADWKTTKYSAKGYGIYDRSLAKRRRDAIMRKYCRETPVTEPFSLDAISVPGSQSKKKAHRIDTKGWTF
jgi:hypothetical protein